MVITEFQRRCPFGSSDTGTCVPGGICLLTEPSDQLLLDSMVVSTSRATALTLISPQAEEKSGVGSSPASIFCENGIHSVITKIFLTLCKYTCD